MPSLDKLLEPFFIFSQSDKRLFYIYLITSFLLGVMVLYFKEKNLKKGLISFFNPKVIKNPSNKVDISLFFFNAFLKIFLFSFVTLSAAGVSKFSVGVLYNIFPDHSSAGWSYGKLMFVYSVVSFLFLDFSRFFQHYLFHKIPFLWRFHMVHHTAKVLTPMTLFRTHPLESLVAAFRRILVTGSVAGFFSFYNQSMIGVYAIMGVNAFDFIFNIFGSNLRHSHIWLSFGPLNYLFISPAQHQVHHSRDKKYYDTNFGIVFSFWDQLFGTFYSPKKKEFISFGVRGVEHRSFKEAVVKPFLREL